jgi:glycosyltransferase involved in cell wall biosynthesis
MNVGRPQRALFIEQFFHPEGWGGAQLPRDITTYLARAGIAVEVVCGSDQYAPVEGNQGADPSESGVRIIRLSSLFGGNLHHRKFLRQAWFYAGLLPKLLLRRPPDLFVTQTNPPLAVPLVAVASRLWRRPCMIIAMDVYPEVLEAHGVITRHSVAGRILARLFSWAYRSAETVVTLGPVMSTRLRSKGVMDERLVEIPNWATGTPGILPRMDSRLAKQWGLADKFVLVYSGNLGIGHEFATLLRGFALAHERAPDLRLVIIGQGSRLGEVRQIAADLQLDQAVRFSGFVPAEQLPESFGLADLAVVTLRAGFEGLIVPSKLPGYMSRGLPVLYIGPASDVSHVIESSGCGYVVGNGDDDAVCRAILDARGDLARLRERGAAGREAYEARWSREPALARYLAVVRGLASSTGREDTA